MKVQPVQKPQGGTGANLFKKSKSKEVQAPVYLCKSCTKMMTDDKRCTCFGRRVEPDYNRCYLHSHYAPRIAQFTPVTNLEEIIEKENKRKVV